MKTFKRVILLLGATVVGAGLIAAPAATWARETTQVTVATTLFRNGGIGRAEANAMRRTANEFSLRLTFDEGPNNDFLANVPVVIADARGKPFFTLDDAGPLLDVMLPNGTYTVTARADGLTETQHVTLNGIQGKDVIFHWNSERNGSSADARRSS